MSEFFDHVAGAALPVAVTLLVLAGVARAVLWSQLDGEERRLAQQYVEPLATWCLIATGAYAFAICVSGEAGVLPLGAAIALAGAAIVLRTNETAAVTAGAPKPTAEEPREPTAHVPTHGRTPEPSASLWDEPSENAKRTGLWAR
jgi:hypothetical protein